MNILIVSGGWDGHEPFDVSDLIAQKLREGGDTVEQRDDITALTNRELLGGFDVIVPNWTMGELPEAGPLAEVVKSGKGLAGWHGGAGDAFRGDPTFQFMVGGQFVQHPGDIRDYTVRIRRPDHPVTEGIGDFSVRSEQYYMHVDPAIEVLAETTFDGTGAPWVAGVTMPAVWTKPFGNGRVFYCSIGHNAADFERAPLLDLVACGIRWAGGA